MKRGWFGPKRFGWGASPASREGWLATFVFALAFCGAFIVFGERLAGMIAALVVFAIFLIVVERTYDPNARTPF